MVSHQLRERKAKMNLLAEAILIIAVENTVEMTMSTTLRMMKRRQRRRFCRLDNKNFYNNSCNRGNKSSKSKGNNKNQSPMRTMTSRRLKEVKENLE